MTGPSTTNKILLRTLQYFLALLLLVTGLGKLLDVPGFVRVLVTYQAIPAWGLQFVAVTLVLVELRIAEWLFRSKSLVLGAFASLVLHGFFTLGTAVTLLRGVAVPNCGCFGVFFARPLTAWTVLEDLVLVAASCFLLRLALTREKFRRIRDGTHPGQLAPDKY